MSKLLRLLDANANRSREALRVMEDAARFLLDDPELSRRLKTLRHQLASAVQRLAIPMSVRDTGGDVGRTIQVATEQQRGTISHVVIAAGKRLSEAVRSLEEFSKLINATAAVELERIRYEGYVLEGLLVEQLVGRLGPSGHADQSNDESASEKKRAADQVSAGHRCAGDSGVSESSSEGGVSGGGSSGGGDFGGGGGLCVLVSESLCPNGHWQQVVKAACAGGVDTIQLREKTLSGPALLDRAKELIALVRDCRGDGADRVAVVINDHPEVALMAQADGVHVGQSDWTVQQVRELVGYQLSVGVSTHDLNEAAAAIDAGADVCGVGAMFPTTTKKRQPSGLDYLKAFVERYPTQPYWAIGGIDLSNIDQIVSTIQAGHRLAIDAAHTEEEPLRVSETGVPGGLPGGIPGAGAGVAVSSVVCQADAPEQIVRSLKQRLAGR